MESNHGHSNNNCNFETCIEEKNISPSYNPNRKIKSENKLEIHGETNFEKKIKKMFDRKKFKLGNEFNQKNSEIFLKDKDECMKDVVLDDTIPHNKKKHLDLSGIKKNQIQNSFCSVGSSVYVKEIVDLLK